MHSYTYQLSYYTKTGLVFGFSKNQILVAVIPGQKAPRTLLGQNSFWILSENYFEMSILIEATYTIKKKNVREILSF